MATGIDFTALIEGERLADTANWANIRRIQDQEDYAIKRERALAQLGAERQGREASHYLSTILPNLQRYADQGLNPVDALINQRSAIQNDPQFQSMAPEVQTQVINGLGQTASLHMQALKNAGNYTDLQRLVDAFGGTNPVNPLGAAVASGDPMAIFNAVNAQSPGAVKLSADGKFVQDATGRQVALGDWAAYVAAGLGQANSAAGSMSAFQAQGQQDRATAAAEKLKAEEERRAAITALASGLDPALVKQWFPDVDVSAMMSAAAPAAAPTGVNWIEGGSQQFVPFSESTPAATPAASAVPSTAAIPVANEVPSAFWSQVAAQVQTANAAQLKQSSSTVMQQIEAGKARMIELSKMQQTLEAQLATYAAEANKYSPFLLDSEKPVAARMVDSIQKQLDAIDAEFGTIARNMKGFTQLSKQIEAKSLMLGLPTTGAPPATSWTTQLQKELGL